MMLITWLKYDKGFLIFIYLGFSKFLKMVMLYIL